MGALASQLYSTIPNSDPLEFGLQKKEIDFRKVSSFLEFDKNALSKIADISKQSVRYDSNIPQKLKERLTEIAIICTLVAEYFEGDAQKTAMWFKAPNPMLGDITPRDMVRLGRSNKLIKFILDAKDQNKAEKEESYTAG